MKNPNGYGTVVKLSGKRRKPWAVRKTAGFNEKGHPVYINIGYAETKEAGMIMLAEYNKSPWDIEADKIMIYMDLLPLETPISSTFFAVWVTSF